MVDIQLPEPLRPSNSKISALQLMFDLEETWESAIIDLLIFYADMHDVRDYIKALWVDYRDGKQDLVTAAVTSNTALELMRLAHDEMVKQTMPGFNNSLGMALSALVLFLQKLQDPSEKSIPMPLPAFTTISHYSELTHQIYDYLLVPLDHMLNGLAEIVEDGCAPVSKSALKHITSL